MKGRDDDPNTDPLDSGELTTDEMLAQTTNDEDEEDERERQRERRIEIVAWILVGVFLTVLVVATLALLIILRLP